MYIGIGFSIIHVSLVMYCISAAGQHWFWQGDSAKHPLIKRGYSFAPDKLFRNGQCKFEWFLVFVMEKRLKVSQVACQDTELKTFNDKLHGNYRI